MQIVSRKEETLQTLQIEVQDSSLLLSSVFADEKRTTPVTNLIIAQNKYHT